MKELFETIIPKAKIYHSPSAGSMVTLKNGSLLLVWGDRNRVQANISLDKGKTWSDPEPLSIPGCQNKVCGFGFR